MFAQAHVYFANEITKSKDPNLLFASIFPDVAWISRGKIDRNKIHSEYAYSLKLDSKFSPIVEGLRYHLALDHFTHDYKGGYAFKSASEIDVEVADLLKIEKGRDSLLMAHNYIEAALELCLVDKFPQVLDLYRDMMSKADKKLFIEYSSKYLDVTEKVADKVISSYIKEVSPQRMSSFKGLSEYMLPNLVGLKFSKEVDIEKSRKILKKAVEIITPTYIDFLNHAINSTKKEMVVKSPREKSPSYS